MYVILKWISAYIDFVAAAKLPRSEEIRSKRPEAESSDSEFEKARNNPNPEESASIASTSVERCVFLFFFFSVFRFLTLGSVLPPGDKVLI